jgi:hypothetical protein
LATRASAGAAETIRRYRDDADASEQADGAPCELHRAPRPHRYATEWVIVPE